MPQLRGNEPILGLNTLKYIELGSIWVSGSLNCLKESPPGSLGRLELLILSS
jgi:hypothetical protein